jgi:hypothetical protein
MPLAKERIQRNKRKSWNEFRQKGGRQQLTKGGFQTDYVR